MKDLLYAGRRLKRLVDIYLTLKFDAEFRSMAVLNAQLGWRMACRGCGSALLFTLN